MLVRLSSAPVEHGDDHPGDQRQRDHERAIPPGGNPSPCGWGGTAFGGSTRHRHEAGSSKVYLGEATALRNLGGADRQLLERSVVGAKREALAQVQVQSGEKQKTLLQKNRDDRRAAFWAFSARPEEKSETASAFVDKLFRLRVDAYVEAIPETAEEATGLVAKTDDGTLTVKLFRAMNEKGEAEVYADSSSLRLPVKVYRQSGIEVIDEVPTLFSE